MVFRKLWTTRRGLWIFVCLLLVTVMSMAPGVSLANGPGMGMHRPWGPHGPVRRYPGHRPVHRPGPITGTLQDVGETDVTIEILLAGHWRHGGQLSEEVVLQVDADTVVFSQDLALIPLEEWEIDTTVTAAARSVWGSPVAKLLYAGTIHDLSERSYRGHLVEDQGDQLLLATPWKEELTVLLVEDTIWVDGGSLGPPDELPVGLPLQILGTKQDDGTVLAALITSGSVRW